MSGTDAGREEKKLSRAGEPQGKEARQRRQSLAQNRAQRAEEGLWVGGAGAEAGPDHGCLHRQELGLCAWETKRPMSNWDDASFQGPSCTDYFYATGCGSHIGNWFFWSLMS